MKFRISKTSVWDDETQPIKEAKRETVPYWDVRSCTEEYYNKHLTKPSGLKWKEKGSEHSCPTKNSIQRILGSQTIWTVEIKTLEDLFKVIKKHGQIIVGENDWMRSGLPTIEIYDNYRE